MSNYFCDSELTTGANNGTSMDDAWQSIETAIESTSPSAGDILWIRRRSYFENPTSNIEAAQFGGLSKPFRIIGCPRNEKSGTGNFTNGKNVVDGISFTPKFEQHCARMIKNNTDGRWYLITAIAYKIDFDNKSGVFTEGLMVTGGTSEAVGKIHKVIDNGETGTLWIVVQSGTFQDNEQITDEDTGIADVNGTPADDGFIIDWKYVGTTVSSAALTIEKDEDYDEFMAIDDSEWTIKKVDWQSDPDDIPKIDFGTNTYYFKPKGMTIYKNLYIKGGSSSYGTIYLLFLRFLIFVNCLLENDQGQRIVNVSSSPNTLSDLYIFFRTVLKGNPSGTFGVFLHGTIYLKDSVIYNCGTLGVYIQQGSLTFLDGVNIGIELPNGGEDLMVKAMVVGKDINLGGKNGYVRVMDRSYPSKLVMNLVHIENWQKTLDAHKNWYNNGEMTKVDVDESSDPKKRTGGGDSVIEMTANQNEIYAPINDELKLEVFCHEFEVNTESRNYRYYIQCKNMNVNEGELFIECEYVDQYESEDKYHYKIVKSDESCSERTGDDDWSQYIEVTGIQPAIASKVRIKCYFSKYDIDGVTYADPETEMT